MKDLALETLRLARFLSSKMGKIQDMNRDIYEDLLILSRSVVARKLRLRSERIDRKGTESLRKVKLRAGMVGDLNGAIISAGYYAKKNDMTYYVYRGNSYGVAVWRVTYKESDVLNPIGNTGSHIAIVEPDLTVKVAEIER